MSTIVQSAVCHSVASLRTDNVVLVENCRHDYVLTFAVESVSDDS